MFHWVVFIKVENNVFAIYSSDNYNQFPVNCSESPFKSYSLGHTLGSSLVLMLYLSLKTERVIGGLPTACALWPLESK